MPASEYFSSSFNALLCFLVLWAFPAAAIARRFSNIPRWICLLAVMGIHTTVLYLKPTSVPLLVAMGAGWVVALGLGWGRRERSARELFRFLPVDGLTLVYTFLLFFLRWEPAGTDPVKWGSFARLLWEHGALPGDVRPLGPLANIQGINLGMPVQIAYLSLGDWVPWERSVSFWECLSLLIFVLAQRQFLQLWFSERASAWAALLSTMLFTNPQQFLNWGGTPTLMGMAGGGILAWSLRSWKPRFLVVTAFALVFTAHAHPIGVYLVGLIYLPILLWVGTRRGGIKSVVYAYFPLALVTGFFFLPFLLRFSSLQTSPAELEEVHRLQERMSFLLHRERYGIVYNLYIQMTTYVWNTAFFVALAAALVSLYRENRWREWMSAGVFSSIVVAVIILNVKVWWLPLSFLLYPERSATLWVWALSLPLAWVAQRARSSPWALAFLVMAFVLGLVQFHRVSWPVFRGSELTLADREVMTRVGEWVPETECISVNRDGGPYWVAVLGFRCTSPYHPLSESIQDETRAWMNRPVNWQYCAPSEKPGPGTVVVDKGAKLVRRP